jgi:hypothetical protein
MDGSKMANDDVELTQEALDQSPREVAEMQLGQTGLRRSSGFLDEDYLPVLNGQRGAETFAKMGNDEVAGAVLFAIQMLIRQAKWHIEAFSEDAEDEEKAEFLKSCFEDMDRPWSESLTEILSMIQYGWSWHEVVFKIRGGPNSTDIRYQHHPT